MSNVKHYHMDQDTMALHEPGEEDACSLCQVYCYCDTTPGICVACRYDDEPVTEKQNNCE